MNINKILKHPLLKSSLTYTACAAINKAVPFLILPILSYYLIPSDYGIVANFSVLLSIISIFAVLGLNGAISVNYFTLSKTELSRYIFNGILLILISSLILIIGIFFLNEIIYSFFKLPTVYQYLSVLMALTSAFTTISLTLFRLEDKPFSFGVYEISKTVLDIGLSLTLVVVYKMGWIGRVDGMLIASLFFGFLSLYIIYRRGYLKFNYDKTFIIAILAFGLPLIPHSLSFWLRSGVDRIFITKYIGEAETGLYATGFQFGILISFLTLSFNNAFLPYMYKLLTEKNIDKLNQNKVGLVKLAYYGIIGLIVMCVVFTIGSNFILEYFFSDKYASASEFIFWAILSQTFQGIYLFFVNYIFFVKKTKYLAMITFFCASLQVVLSYLLINKIGAIGAAYSTACISFINLLLVAYYSNKVYDMPWLEFFRTSK